MSRFLLVAVLFVCGLSCPAAAQNRASFTVGTATAARGQKAIGTIEVPAGVDAALSIPVAVFHGAKPGPVLAVVAGSHGTEYTSIIALEKLIATLNPAEISGTGDHRSTDQYSIVRTESPAPESGRQEKHEPLVSRQDGWDAD